MTIRPSIIAHEHEFRDFWMAAAAYQKAAQVPQWLAYPEEKIREEIQKGLHLSAFLPDDILAGFFSLELSDPIIWGVKEKGDAIYLHRMCGNPACKGNRLAEKALKWAQEYAVRCGRKFVRMDTWGNNPRLVKYYAACGFRYVGDHHLGNDLGNLSSHYQNAHLALFENEV